MAEQKLTLIIDAKGNGSTVVKQMTQETTKNADNMASALQSGAKKASVALAATGVALTAYAKNAMDFTVDLYKESANLARQTNTTVEESSRLMYVFRKSGLEASAASASFVKLSRTIASAREESTDAAFKQAQLNNKIEATNIQIAKLTAEQKKNGDKSGELRNKISALQLALQGYRADLNATTSPLAKLGVATQNADKSNRSFSEILLDVADKFKAMPNGVEKTATAVELFGRSGAQMVKVLNLGRDGIIELEQQADKLGMTLTSKNVTAIQQYIASQKQLKDTTDAMKISVASLTAPVMTEFNTKLNELLLKATATDAPMRGLTANVLAFGGPAAGFIGAAIGVAANLTTIAASAGAAKAAITGTQATAALGIFLPTAAAVASLGALWFAATQAKNALDKVRQSIDELNKKKVQVGNTNIKASGTSDVGLIQQFMNYFKGYAAGTNFAPGGTAIVGEEGPELVNLPRGSQVVPAPQTREILSSGGGSSSTNITVNVHGTGDSMQTANRVVREIGWQLALAA